MVDHGPCNVIGLRQLMVRLWFQTVCCFFLTLSLGRVDLLHRCVVSVGDRHIGTFGSWSRGSQRSGDQQKNPALGLACKGEIPTSHDCQFTLITMEILRLPLSSLLTDI